MLRCMFNPRPISPVYMCLIFQLKHHVACRGVYRNCDLGIGAGVGEGGGGGGGGEVRGQVLR